MPGKNHKKVDKPKLRGPQQTVMDEAILLNMVDVGRKMTVYEFRDKKGNYPSEVTTMKALVEKGYLTKKPSAVNPFVNYYMLHSDIYPEIEKFSDFESDILRRFVPAGSNNQDEVYANYKKHFWNKKWDQVPDGELIQDPEYTTYNIRLLRIAILLTRFNENIHIPEDVKKFMVLVFRRFDTSDIDLDLFVKSLRVE